MQEHAIHCRKAQSFWLTIFLICNLLAVQWASADPWSGRRLYAGDAYVSGDFSASKFFGNVSGATITDVSNQIPQDDLEYILSELWARPTGTDILDTVFQNKYGILVHPADGIFGSIIDNSTNWTTAYDERRQWDGGATNLNAATGRTSLELNTYYSGINHNHGFGSTGTIPKFSNTSGGLANSVIIESASKIGIGATPSVLLDVQQSVAGNNNILKLLNTDTGNRNTYMFIGQGLATGRSFGSGFQDNSDGTSGYGWMSVYGDAAGAALVVKKGGNIGIGTTSPAYKLDVNGSARIVGTALATTPSHVAVQSDSNNVLKWQTWGDFINNLALSGEIGGGNIGGTGSTGYVAKFINSATLANSVIQDDGTNIGVGKTPVTGIKLDVAGNIRAQDDLFASTLSVGIVSKANVSSATITDASNQIPQDDLEYILSELWYKTGISFSERRQWDGGATNLVPATGRNSLQLDTYYSGIGHNHGAGTVRYLTRWNDGSGGLTSSVLYEAASGFIGFGTTSPQAKLSIQAGNILTSGSSGYLVNRMERTDANKKLEVGVGIGNEGAYLGFSNTGYLSIGSITGWNATNWSEMMRLNASGNIGLATTTPTSKLHIVGPKNNDINGITLGTLSTSYKTVKGRIGHNFDSLYITNNASYVGGTWTRDEASPAQLIYLDNFSDAGAIRFNAGGTSGLPPERMTITKDGNVGIATTAPAYVLDVSGEARVSKLNFPDTYGDKLFLKSNLYGVNVDVNEFNLFSDRYFTMSSDTNQDAFVFDADTGNLTIEGKYTGDGSGLSYVDADTLGGYSANDFVKRIGDSMYGDLDMTTAKVIFNVSPDIKLRFGTSYHIEIEPYTLTFRSDNNFLFENDEGLPMFKLNGDTSQAIVYSDLDLQANNLTQANKIRMNSLVFETARTEATEGALLAALESGEVVLWKPDGQPLAMAVKYGQNDLRWQTLITMADAQNWPNDKYALAIEYNGEIYLAQVHRGY